MDLDFLLSLVKYHRYTRSLYIQNLACLALVLGLNNAYLISWFKVLADVGSIDIKRLCELGNSDRFEGD